MHLQPQWQKAKLINSYGSTLLSLSLVLASSTPTLQWCMFTQPSIVKTTVEDICLDLFRLLGTTLVTIMIQSLGQDRDDSVESSPERISPFQYWDEITLRYIDRQEIDRVTEKSADKSLIQVVSVESTRVISSQIANLHFTNFLLLIFLLFLFSIFLNIIYNFQNIKYSKFTYYRNHDRYAKTNMKWFEA